MKDLHSKISVEQAIAPKTYSTGITGTVDIDLKGYNSAEIEITYGDHADTLSGSVDFDVDLEHADPLSTGLHDTFADVAQADVLGCTLATGAIINHVEADADTNQVYRIGYVGGKRFLKVAVTANGTHSTGTIIGVNVIKGDPENAPVADTVPTLP
jgi:hypothetical protein